MKKNDFKVLGRKLVAVLSILVCASCQRDIADTSFRSEESKADRIEVFYRSFHQLTPISLSERDLESMAPVKITVTERNDIDSLLKAIDIPCDVTDQISEEKMDVYIYIKKFYRNEKVGAWKASPFHFSADPGSGEVCLLEKVERDRLGGLIEKLAQK